MRCAQDLRSSRRREARRSSGASRRTDYSLAPFIGLFGKIRPLHAHHAKALARGRLHDPPRANLRNALRAQLLEPFHLSLDIIGLNVQVYATGVLNLLHFYVQIVGRRIEEPVTGVLGTGRLLQRVAQRLAPEARGLIDVIGTAVDDEPRESALVHGHSPLSPV